MKWLLCACLFVGLASTALSQTSPFNTILLSKPTAEADRNYLGIFGSSGTNYTPGTNIVFVLVGPYTYSINVSNFALSGNYILNTSGFGTNTTVEGYLWVDGNAVIINYSNYPTLLFNGKDSGGNQVFGNLYLDPTNDVFGFTYPLDLTNGNGGATLRLHGGTNVWMSFGLTNGISGDLTYDASGFGFDDSLTVDGDVATYGQFNGSALGLTNFPGLSITQNVVLWSGTISNLVAYTNVYKGGLLMASGPAGPTHGPSLLLEGGGYLLLESGGTILLE